ncbi:uncharacterized protein LOC120111634 [Phoenix dactylifera]|uniref:Uncharacterized protein LOC120111634 n=1 Tax=Phoenix dactylifera TaxID=42345 RepID=A0A8B9AFQ4_PHODC|nr:uncharacterized protein LOC120111634 [Phoenix dactylifera]
MCFKTPEVCTPQIDCLVRAIISVLSPSIPCKILLSEQRGGAELLRVGSSIFSRDCYDLIRVCGDVIEILESHGVYEENEGILCDRRTAISKPMCFLPKERPSSSHEIAMRNIT